MAMPRSLVAVEMVRDAGLPYIVLLTDPTTGGVSASFAMLGDIALSEPGATIGFAGKRVIEETIRESLPEGFQSAEYLVDHGMVDMVVRRDRLRDTLVNLISLLRDKAPMAEVVPIKTGEATAKKTPARKDAAQGNGAEEAAGEETAPAPKAAAEKSVKNGDKAKPDSKSEEGNAPRS